MAKLFKVLVELYELLLTTRKDDRSGRVVSTGSLRIDDLIAIAVSRRSDINAATMKASYEILKEVVLEEVCGAKQVEFGLSHYGLGVNGVFIGDHPVWDGKTHSLILHASATAEARMALKNIEVDVLGMAQSGIFINSLTDVVSGEINTRLTPGGSVNLAGARIKIAGDAPNIGLHLTEINTGTITDIPATSVPVNDPSRIIFIVPTDLPAGDYKLSIITQFSHSTLLKEPRTCVFDYILSCIA
ncbi:MAG: DUF4469 domain-containing protein [Dysgonamonadaceae bacterium]|jgi:hypothetical protein|nr:DUF4469 domain-containing protein [Dysgonamonadaceae bacterium]